jgi:hypothetical protein
LREEKDAEIEEEIEEEKEEAVEKEVGKKVEKEGDNDKEDEGDINDLLPENYGLCRGEGSVWVEWLVNCCRSGCISIGAMTEEAADDPDAR